MSQMLLRALGRYHEKLLWAGIRARVHAKIHSWTHGERGTDGVLVRQLDAVTPSPTPSPLKLTRAGASYRHARRRYATGDATGLFYGLLGVLRGRFAYWYY